MAPARQIHVIDLGRTRYADAHAFQLDLREQRIASTTQDTLLLTEHEPVITLGRSHPEADLRVPETAVHAAGIDIVQTERGGDITYHGPGQLVAYGIIDLRGWKLGVVDYVDGLERATIMALRTWGIEAGQRRDARGVWCGARKIASVGVHVRRWVTLHGIAINVSPDFEHFDLINPCGMADVEMTGIERESGRGVTVDEAGREFVRCFSELFECTIEERRPADVGADHSRGTTAPNPV
jgi:lipoate-protein ligase B